MLERAGSVTDGRLLFESVDAVIERRIAPVGRFPLIASMFVERGTKDDWDLLSDLHYKGHTVPPGPRFWRLVLEDETIGVLVTGTPRGLLRERHQVFPILGDFQDNNQLINTQRYIWINQNFRVISRFVVDTMYRGIGVGYRMMNLVSRMEGKRFMEIQSSMAKFNQFGQKAGFRYVKPVASQKHDVGMKFFRQNFASNPQDFEAIVAEILSQPEAVQAIIMKDVKEFYYRHSASEKMPSRRGKTSRVEDMSVRETIHNLQQLVMASPMYGLFENPDLKTTLPDRLPLTAFDAQGVREPLRWGHASH